MDEKSVRFAMTGHRTPDVQAGKCVDCRFGKVRALVNYGRGKGCKLEDIDCPICLGTGHVGSQRAEEINAARRLYEDRVGRGVSLSEEAKRLGISAQELSRREHAR